jgi:hypothetical protein
MKINRFITLSVLIVVLALNSAQQTRPKPDPVDDTRPPNTWIVWYIDVDGFKKNATIYGYYRPIDALTQFYIAYPDPNIVVICTNHEHYQVCQDRL